MGWLLAGVVRTRILEIKGNFDGVLVGGRKLLQREELGDWWRKLWWGKDLAVVSSEDGIGLGVGLVQD